jgi:hypothetical protein
MKETVAVKVEIMVPSNVVHSHLILKDHYPLQSIPVFQEYSGRISPPHVYDVSKQNKIRGSLCILLNTIEKAVKGCLIRMLIPQVYIG